MLHLFIVFTLPWQVLLGIALCQTHFQVLGSKMTLDLVERGGVDMTTEV